MKVIATERGFWGSLHEVGSVFDVPDDATAPWFRPAPVEQAPESPFEFDDNEDGPIDDYGDAELADPEFVEDAEIVDEKPKGKTKAK